MMMTVRGQDNGLKLGINNGIKLSQGNGIKLDIQDGMDIGLYFVCSVFIDISCRVK